MASQSVSFFFVVNESSRSHSFGDVPPPSTPTFPPTLFPRPSAARPRRRADTGGGGEGGGAGAGAEAVLLRADGGGWWGWAAALPAPAGAAQVPWSGGYGGIRSEIGRDDLCGLFQPNWFCDSVTLAQRVPRTGWVYRNVANPESVSDHMYRMAMMALVTEDKSLNKDRCIRLALVHDMAECIVGDIAPADNISKEEKHRREEAAMQQLTQLLSEDLKKEVYELWEEYENQSTAEAKFVKQLDQCEMILQAFEYEELENTPGRLQDFFDSTAGKFVHPEILQLVSLINRERKKKIASTSHPHS